MLNLGLVLGLHRSRTLSSGSSREVLRRTRRTCKDRDLGRPMLPPLVIPDYNTWLVVGTYNLDGR